MDNMRLSGESSRNNPTKEQQRGLWNARDKPNADSPDDVTKFEAAKLLAVKFCSRKTDFSIISRRLRDHNLHLRKAFFPQNPSKRANQMGTVQAVTN